ncbi:MAG TPA: GC-type dockerin domain-anchored protein [Phycisphaerales bacterium]|nr:GC-type dockerin domain-anchored protein [Phycisphaerales bacterium]
MVPVSTPFTIEMILQVNAQVQVPHGASISTSTTTDFGHTASFATSGPAFNLPPGYTANSAQAGVVNNSFALPPTGCPGDLGTTGGLPGRDGVRDNNDFVAFIDYFFARNPLADMGATGGTPGPDGQFDNNDFIVFIDAFFTPCP